jgi:hypothetical protein
MSQDGAPGGDSGAEAARGRRLDGEVFLARRQG